MRIHPFACACVATLLLSACDGDSRPFEEAVEVRNLFLESTTLVPPQNSQPEIFINFGQTFQLGVKGVNVSGEDVTLSGNGRQWLTSNSAIASVDENGLVTGHSRGAVNVVVDIGNIRSAPFLVRVSNASLVRIQSIIGSSMVERCLPGDYRAVGLFDDRTTRNLPATDWSVTLPGSAEPTDDARESENADASVTLTGLNPGIVQLNASLDSQSFSRQIEILDSLDSISITPSPAGVDVDRIQDFTAQGTYTGPSPAVDPAAAPGPVTDPSLPRIRNITGSVNWEITTGNDFATVSNSGTTRGQLTGVASGSANLRASCGNLSVDQSVDIRARAGSSSANQLSFSEEGPLALLRGARAELSVATGLVYNDANRITGGITCSVESTSSTTAPVAVETIDNSRCRVQANAEGTATVTATRSGGGSVSIVINARLI